MNPRVNGSQAFQEQYRIFAQQYPYLAGLNANLTFPQGVNFSDFRNQLGRLLFDRETLGVLPVAFRSNDAGKNPVVKCSILEDSTKNLQSTLREIQELGIKV